MPWEDKEGLAMWATIFAMILMVSLGLCGLNYVAVMTLKPNGQFATGVLVITAYLEVAGMFIGITGLVAVMFVGIVKLILSGIRGGKEND